MEQLDLFAPPVVMEQTAPGLVEYVCPTVVGYVLEWLIKHNARRGENGWIAG